MPQYLLALHHDLNGSFKISPEEMQKAVEKYVAWTRKPFVAGSRRLAPEPGRVIRDGGRRVSDGPYSETKEILGGYYVIEAGNYDEAAERSMDHPHLHYGGTIELRQIHQM